MGDHPGGMKRFLGRLGSPVYAWLHRRWLFRFGLRLWGEAKTSLYRNAIYLMATSVLGQGLGFFFWAIVTYVYLKADIGFAVALFSTISVVANLALLGFTASLIRYLPEAEDQADLLNTTLTLVGITALLLGLGFLLVIAVFGLELSFTLDSLAYPVTILAGVLACGLAPVLDSAAIALRRSDIQMWRVVALGVLKIPLAVAIAMTLTGAFGIGRFGVLLALVVATGASVLIEGVWLLPRILPGYRPAIRTTFGRLRPLMRFSNGNYVASVISSAGSGLLPLLILLVLGAGAAANVSYFYVASTVAALLSVISISTFTSFFAEASYRNANRHRDERRALLLTLGLLAPAIVVFWIFAPFVLLLFGGGTTPDYAIQGTTPLRILTLASIPAVANNLLTTRVRVRRRTLPLIVGAAISSVVVRGLGYNLLQRAGITGLSIALVVAAAAVTPYYWFAARKSFESEPLEPTEMLPIQP